MNWKIKHLANLFKKGIKFTNTMKGWIQITEDMAQSRFDYSGTKSYTIKYKYEK